MKKNLIIIMVLVFAILAVGCNNTSNEKSIPDDVSAGAIAEKIMSEVEIQSAVPYIDEYLLSGMSEYSHYICGSGAYPDELLIIKFDSSENANNAKTSFQKRFDERKTDFKDYRPDEMYKFDDAAVMVSSNWLFMYITEDNAKVKEIINSFIQ